MSYSSFQDGHTVSGVLGATVQEIGDYEAGELLMTSDAPVLPHLLGPGGGMRTGALLALIDNVGGLCGGLGALPDGWVVSTNLAARTVPGIEHGRSLHLRARVLRRGKAAVVTAIEARAGSDDGPVVADASLTSAVLVPENGAPQWPRPVVIPADPGYDDVPSLLDWVGIRAVDDSTLMVDVRDELRNPWGIVHGGVTATLIDAAAEHEATNASRAQCATTDAVIHFLSPARVGPLRATVAPLGDRPDGRVARVELHDEGVDDRVVAFAVTTARRIYADSATMRPIAPDS